MQINQLLGDKHRDHLTHFNQPSNPGVDKQCYAFVSISEELVSIPNIYFVKIILTKDVLN